jgi:hypothetical protein
MTVSQSEALSTLDAAWTAYYEAEKERIENEVEFLKAVHAGRTGSASMELAVVQSAEAFLVSEINNFLRDPEG